MSLFKPYYKDLATLHVGCEAPRAYFVPYSSLDDALTHNRAASPFFLSLCGDWDFRFFPRPDIPEKMTLDELHALECDKMTVPASWENFVGRGYDTPNYTNFIYPFPVEPPVIPEENPTALYSRKFTLNSSFLKNKDIFLNFEGVSSCFYVWVNGTQCAYSEVSHCTSEINITKLLHVGENTIDVLVMKYSTASYLEDQDMFRCGGIFREVYLLARDKKCIRDIFVTCELSKSFAKATFTTKIEGELQKNASFALLDADGNDTGALIAADIINKTVTFTVNRPKLWSSEVPYLYHLCIENGNEHISLYAGARKIEIKNRVILINGKKVKARGVNRHDSSPVTGYATPMDHIMRDLYILKQNNCNMIRTSHYPNDPRLVEQCDRLGFYLVDEADLETHGFDFVEGFEWSHLSKHPDWTHAYVDRAVRLFERDKNSVSVIMLSLGNESGMGENQIEMAKYIRSRDNTRIVHYEGANYTFMSNRGEVDKYYAKVSDVESYMYPEIDFVDKYCSDKNEKFPFFLCEYAHAMGNGPGDLAAYWELFYKHDNLFGGCVWEFCDHAALLGGTPERPEYGYGGSFGEPIHADNFCMDGLVYPDRRLHTGMLEFKEVVKPYRITALNAGKGKFRLENLRNFTSLEDITLTWSLEADGKAIASGIYLPKAAPETYEDLALPFPKVLPEGTVCANFTFAQRTSTEWADIGYETGHTQIVIERNDYIPSVKKADTALELCDSAEAVTVCASNTAYTFDKTSGMLSQITDNGADMLCAPMSVAFVRAPMDNDKFQKIRWNRCGLFEAVPVYDSFNVSSTAKRATLKAKLHFVAKEQTVVSSTVTYTIGADGKMEIKLDAKLHNIDVRFFPRIGICLPAKKDIELARYFGYGPMESYVDKRQAARLGIFTTSATDNHEPYLYPQENGAHYSTSWLDVHTHAGHGMLFTMQDEPFSFDLSHYSVKNLANAHYAHKLEEENVTYINIDAYMSGCGSNSCGPRLNEKYQLKAGKYTLRVLVSPCRSGDIA